MIVKISFDDASQGDADLADMLVKYGMESQTVFYWPVLPGAVNEPKHRKSLSIDQMRNIAQTFEIGSHTVTHRHLTRISIDEAKYEIKQSKVDLEKMFSHPIRKFCYPRGYANPEIQEIVKDAGYDSARGVTVGHVQHSQNPYYENTSVHVGCDRKEYGGKPWYDYAIDMLETASQTEDSVFHMWGHAYELMAYPRGVDLFDSLLKQVKERS